MRCPTTKALFNSELAAHLLRDPVPPARRAGRNGRLMSILGVAESAREAQESERDPLSIDIQQFNREEGELRAAQDAGQGAVP